MSRVHLIIVLLCACTMIQAQEGLHLRTPSKENKLVQLDIDLGGRFDLAYRRDGNMLTSMSDQGASFFGMNLRLQHFFARKWGWYANVYLGFPDKYARNSGAELAQEFEAEYYVSSLSNREKPEVNPCLEGGIVFRMENARWAFYPRLGIGVSSMNCQTVHANLKKRGGNELYRVECLVGDLYGSSNIDAFVVSAGFTVNYKLSRHCYLLLNANYRQPLGKFECNEYMKDLYTGESVTRRTHSSTTLMRDLNVSIGVGFPIYLWKEPGPHQRKVKTTRKERMRNIMDQKRKNYGIFPKSK